MADGGARRSALPSAVYEDLVRVGLQLDKRINPAVVQAALSGLSQLPASAIVPASAEIADAARLNWWPHRRTWPILHLINAPRSDFDNLRDHSALAWLFIFHRNGRVREVALNVINSPPQSPFFLSAIIQRLNDWAEPVRAAAVRCADRVFPDVPAEAAASVALTFLPRYLAWGRWQNVERDILDRLLARADVVATIAERLREGSVGPLATCLRHVLRYPAIDNYLSILTDDAVQPQVRATAFECLVYRRASWPVGFGWEWVDKVFNQKKRIALYESREISSSHPLDQTIRNGLMDTSVFVRRVAADALIANRQKISEVDGLVRLLESDRSPSIRERVDYLKRHPKP